MSFTPKISTNTMPVQKTGTETPMLDKKFKKVSMGFPRFNAETIPMVTPRTTERINAMITKDMVIPSLGKRTSEISF